MGGSIYSFRNGPQQGHRTAMESSCCDMKIQFNFITDPVCNIPTLFNRRKVNKDNSWITMKIKSLIC
jgi:hypothetical protein